MITDWSVVSAVVDRFIPDDDYPSASQAGVVDELIRDADTVNAELWRTLLAPGIDALEADAVRRHHGGFSELTPQAQDALLAELVEVRERVNWPVSPGEFHSTLVRLACESYYGTNGSSAWRMIGFNPGLRRAAGARNPDLSKLFAGTLSDADERYDALVVGLGAGGGVAASVLAEAGLKVLGVDRGRYLSFEEIGRDHLRNFRLSTYGHNTPPRGPGDPRLVTGLDDVARTVSEPWQPGWAALPQTIGGGTRVYQGMAWRLLPRDFQLASDYGVPEGSSLADWPIGYHELEQYYGEIEWELGVCGDGGTHRNQGFRSRDYPMPPLPDNTEAQVLRDGAERLGWSTGPVPLLINSEPRAGRGRCGQCGLCVGFACPTDAKNGPFNALLPRAAETGNLTFSTGTRATRIVCDHRGTVTGVELKDERTGAVRTIMARHIVIACSAIETARLLLVSRSASHPDGVGNSADQVGRNLQGHLYVGAFGEFEDPVIDGPGPNVRIATCDHIHATPGLLGGVLANEVVKLPALHWHWALPPDAPRTGVAGKRAMERLYRRTSHVFGPIQEIPSPEGRVTLAKDLRDASGMPAPHISGSLHPDNAASADELIRKAETWLEAAGATRTWTVPYTLALTPGQHQAGTCRMGDDPNTSVTDRWGRVHGHDNLWVMDASVHVTNGGFNPVLTVLALALRSSRYLAETA